MRGPWLIAAGHAGRQAAYLRNAAAGGVLNAIRYVGYKIITITITITRMPYRGCAMRTDSLRDPTVGVGAVLPRGERAGAHGPLHAPACDGGDADLRRRTGIGASGKRF